MDEPRLSKGECVSWIISEMESKRDSHKAKAHDTLDAESQEFHLTWVDAYKEVIQKFYK